MVKLFEKKKTKEDIDAEYASALAGFQLLSQPSARLINGDEEPADVDISLESSGPLVPLLNNAHKFTQNELVGLENKIKEKVALDPNEKPLMTRALNAVTKAVNNPSPQNLKELMWTALAVSRKGDALSGISASMTGIGFSLFITSLIVGATVAATTAAFPIMVGVAVGLMLTGAIVFMAGLDHILISENSKVAKEIKGIRATLSRL